MLSSFYYHFKFILSLCHRSSVPMLYCIILILLHWRAPFALPNFLLQNAGLDFSALCYLQAANGISRIKGLAKNAPQSLRDPVTRKWFWSATYQCLPPEMRCVGVGHINTFTCVTKRPPCLHFMLHTALGKVTSYRFLRSLRKLFFLGTFFLTC